MSHLCRVIEVFHTSIGQFGLLGFFDETTPYLGMQFKDELGREWQVHGIGKNLIDSFERKEQLDDGIKSLWDCILQGRNEGYLLKKGALFYRLI